MGAFAAHGLRARLSAPALELVHTAAQYEALHSLAILAVAALAHAWGHDSRAAGRGHWLRCAAAAFAIGIVLFSGSLYLLALTGQRWLGAITPFGGVAFLVGWGLVAMAGWRGRG